MYEKKLKTRQYSNGDSFVSFCIAQLAHSVIRLCNVFFFTKIDIMLFDFLSNDMHV